MRDTLTALAGVVILVLVAALAAPPFVDWAAHRAFIDRTIAASLGLPARSEGRIEVRLLPSPRLRLDRVQLGGEAGRPSLDARFVKAELALAPLLKGEFRFTETRIGRAEVKLPVTETDALVLPPGLGRSLGERDLVIEDLHVAQFLLTTQVPATGRTDQLLAENLRLKAPSLAGPWQAEGASGGLPFRVATSTLGPDGSMTLKISGGGEGRLRFESDARVALRPLDPAADARALAAGEPRSLVPEAEGTARLVLGASPQAAGGALPFSLGGRFKARGPIARFEGVSAEIDPGGQAVRLTGTGRIDLRSWRAALNLESRRINLDGLIYSTAGQALMRRGLPAGGVTLPVMLDLDLKAESLAFGFEDWSDLQFKGTFDRTGGLLLRRFAGTAPGAAAVQISGEVDVAPEPRFNGHVDLDAANTDGLGRYLQRLGAEGPALALLDGRAIQAATDLSAASGDVSLRNLRLTLGEARITGNARYVREGAGSRGRFDAQLAAKGIDIAELPPLGGFLAGLERHDVGLKIRARDVRYGPAGTRSGNGTIAASIQSDGASLVVDSLDVTDLAGANARLSGRIAPDGAGRIAGHVSAPVAAPLIALVERVFVAETRLVPRFVREGPLDLDVALEREAGAAETLRSTVKGKAGETTIDLSLLTRANRIDALDLAAAAPKAARWFGREDIAGLRQPATLTLSGRSAAGADRLDLTLSGTIAGLTVSTPKPLALGRDQEPPGSGTLRLETADLSPFATLATGAILPGTPLPADLTVALSRKDADAHAEVSGRIAGAPVTASLDRDPDGRLGGRASLAALSLPALAAALVMPTDPRGAGGDPAWSSARFAPAPTHPHADLGLKVERLDLGRGLVATGAVFGLALDRDSLAVKDLSGALAGGRIAGSATIARQGSAATVSGEGHVEDVAIRALAGEGAPGGRLSATLRYSAGGDSAAALVGNLSGSGEITLAGLTLPGADPAAIDRTLARALAEDDPLREGRVQALLAEEFSAGALEAAGPVSTSVTLVGGTLRSGPVALDLGPARWAGTFAVDLRLQRLDARGTLTARDAPKGWTGAKPSVQLGFSGPLRAPQREIDPGPLSNGLAALVLQRELEKIELFEADQTERIRRRARIEMDRARAAALKAAAEKAAQEKAAQDKAAAEEAARTARARAQQAAAEEAARQARDRRESEDAARRAPPAQQPDSEPLDIRPPQP